MHKSKAITWVSFFIGIVLIGCSFTVVPADEINPTKPIEVKIRDDIRVDTHLVEMRDGVHLATDVYFGKNSELPHGSFLIRTPYNKDLNTVFHRPNDHWPVIVQDTRGRFASEGNYDVFRRSYQDGSDTIAWIASQPFSNGKVITYGGSALGIDQYFVAAENPQNLAGQIIIFAAPDLYRYVFQQGGQFRQELVEAWLEDRDSLHIIDEFFEHEKHSKDYWSVVSIEDKWGNIEVPAIHVAGWYDCFAQGTIDGFLGYNYEGGIGAAGNSKLVIGPWSHNFGREQGELIYPENASHSFIYTMFDDMAEQYAMDRGDRYHRWPTVRYYVMGDVDDDSAPGNQWLVADHWPVPYEPVSVYLGNDNNLNINLHDSSSYNYEYDPLDPVLTLGGQNLNIPSGPYDQQLIEQRADVIVFTSDILTEPVWIVGPIIASLFVSSNQYDTDFTVKLTDVYPDGRSMLITDGILRMRNRNSLEYWEFIEPGEIYEIEVDLWSTAYIFNKGHRIRVSISSSNAPRFLPNSNNTDGYRKSAIELTAENTIYAGHGFPSRIILPLSLLEYEVEVKRASEVISQEKEN